MASRARTRLTLDEVLSGVFDDDFGLSDTEIVRRKEKMFILTLESKSSPWRGGSAQQSC